jgi:hypothetical protein
LCLLGLCLFIAGFRFFIFLIGFGSVLGGGLSALGVLFIISIVLLLCFVDCRGGTNDGRGG